MEGRSFQGLDREMNKKNLKGIGGLLLGTAMALHSSEVNFPKLTGPYLGQKPPGKIPEVFAPAVISTADFREFSGAFTPDERFHIFDFNEKLYVCFQTERGTWGAPIDLSQKLDLPDGEILPTLSPDRQYLFFCNRGDIYWVSAKVIEELRPKDAMKE